MKITTGEITRFGLRCLFGVSLMAASVVAMGSEEAKFETLKTDGSFELRLYAARVVAETTVTAGFEEAGNMAFNRLFGYISGKNRARQKIAMTAPVTQEQRTSEEIAMTAPVTQEASGPDQFRVTFILPAKYDISNAPEPQDSLVKIVAEPERHVAALKYSGNWSTKLYETKLRELNDWVTSSSLTATGPPVWARYNPPFSLPVFRRNEILIPVKKPASVEEGTPRK